MSVTGRVVQRVSPVAGLDRRRLSFIEVLAQSVSAVAPSAVMVTLPILVMPDAGGMTIAVFATAAALMAVVGYCTAQFARRMVAVSGLYSYTAKGLGAVPGFVAGWSLLIGHATAAMASVLGAAVYSGALLSRVGLPIGTAAVATLAVAIGILAMMLMIRGISLSARTALAVEVCSIIVASVVLVLIYVRSLHTPPTAVVHHVNAVNGSTGFALLLAITSFVGFESAGTVASEGQHPFVSVPRALLWTPTVLGVLYVFAAAAQFFGAGGTANEASTSPMQLADVGREQGSAVLSVLLDVGVAGSWFACVIGSTTALTRILFAMGREGVVPTAFGRAHPRFHTPHVALVVAMPIIVAVPAVFIWLSGSARTVLVDLLITSAHGYVLAYILVCIATPAFLRKIGELTSGPLVAGTLAAGTLGVLVVWNTVSQEFSSTGLTVVYCALLAVGALVLAIRRKHSPGCVARIGIYDEPIEADMLPLRTLPGRSR
ncbi:MAG: APC family permease [Mycobacteriaceae bacterium]